MLTQRTFSVNLLLLYPVFTVHSEIFMADTKRKHLKGKTPWGGNPGPGCLSMGCSTPLIVFGWLGLSYIIKDHEAKVLQPFLTAIGWMLFLFGLYFLFSGIRSFSRWVRYRIRRRKYPDQPWMYDYLWRSEGFACSPLSDVIHYINLTVMFGAFSLPWNMFAFHPDMPLFINIIVGIPVLAFDAAVVFCAWKAIRTWIHWIKYGMPYIWFEHFPFRPGEEMTVGLGATKETGPYTEMVVTLRLIERIESKGGSDHGPSLFQEYADIQKIKEPEGFILGEKEPIPVTFILPADVRTTSLSGSEVWYWELTAEVPTEGVDFKAEFLLPVYGNSEEKG